VGEMEKVDFERCKGEGGGQGDQSVENCQALE
jgi:hypothetical protein